MMYLGYVLQNQSRIKLLKQFPPKYPDVICHHVTLRVHSFEAILPPSPNLCEVIGYADSGDGVETLVVTIDGLSLRPDGNLFHITHSIDRVAGKKPVDSNKLISKGFQILPSKTLFFASTRLVLS